MKIFITIPSFSIHGGIRIILEWANRLAVNHEVYLRVLRRGVVIQCWFPLDRRVKLVFNDDFLPRCDLLLITSPHAAHYLANPRAPTRKVIFLQMMEHLFHPGNHHWLRECQQLYRSPHPLITISLWNWQSLLDDFGRAGPVHYVGNGVNLQHFPIEPDYAERNDGRTVLIEGICGTNPTKDRDNLGVKVALSLAARGYRIISYGGHPVPYRAKNWECHMVRPALNDLNALYARATILIKASRFDARACAPVEAMTKGVPTVRAIVKGDDDLLPDQNCLKVDYEQNALSLGASRLLEDHELRRRLSAGCLEHVQAFSWAYWWPQIELILTTDNTDNPDSRIPKPHPRPSVQSVVKI